MTEPRLGDRRSRRVDPPDGVGFTDSEGSAAGELLIVGLPEMDLFVLHAACCRRICRCFRASSSFPIPLGMDLLLTPGEYVLGCDVADGTVQPDVVVMLDVALYQTARIVQRQWRSRPDALSFERLCQRSIFPFDWG